MFVTILHLSIKTYKLSGNSWWLCFSLHRRNYYNLVECYCLRILSRIQINVMQTRQSCQGSIIPKATVFVCISKSSVLEDDVGLITRILYGGIFV